MIKKLASGKWKVDVRTNGRGSKRYRKVFDSKAEARRFESFIEARKAEGVEWNPSKERRSLKDLIEQWYSAHGQTLKDGARRKRKLDALADRMGNPLAADFSAGDFANYRRLRIEMDGVKENTMNREHSYLNAVFNELARLGQWERPNPVARIRKFKIDEQELAYLEMDQIERVLEECLASSNPSVYAVARLAFATGARWSEAETVGKRNFRPYRVTYTNTKSGKTRSIPIARPLYEELLPQVPFTSCYGAFRSAVKRAGIDLPDGQLTHICRHTFASHFVMRGGDILTLQKILGHSDIKLTMRYAHLSPSHIEKVVSFAPSILGGPTKS